MDLTAAHAQLKSIGPQLYDIQMRYHRQEGKLEKSYNAIIKVGEATATLEAQHSVYQAEIKRLEHHLAELKAVHKFLTESSIDINGKNGSFIPNQKFALPVPFEGHKSVTRRKCERCRGLFLSLEEDRAKCMPCASMGMVGVRVKF